MKKFKRLSVKLMHKLFFAFNSPTSLTKVFHFGVISPLNSTIDFAFKGGNEKYLYFLGNTAT